MLKRQSYTTQSSAHVEIGAVNECTKAILYLINLLQDLNLYHNFNQGPIDIFNDNSATVHWSHNMTTKELRYIQIRENAIRESIKLGTVNVKHIGGKTNPSDIFTKEDRDINHFIQCCDTLCSTPLVQYTSV